MSGFAIYRMPYADHAVLVQQTEGEPEEYHSCIELNGKSGFVVAPFEVTEQQPILLIRPDKIEEVELRDMSVAGNSLISHPSSLTPSSTYAIDFANYHAQLEAGSFRKIVLARCVEESSPQPIDSMELFYRACHLYPRMFISLASTTKSGCWLTATPEILLEGEGGEWRTIALAGTMKLEGEQLASEGETLSWTTKNIQEQRIVATYIAECLEQFTGDFHEEGPRAVRAADLVHLRSDFTFHLNDSEHLGDLLHALHPTPAVCGLPKREAFNFIIHNEYTPRRYYSGFMGPINAQCTMHNSQSLSTHLYVSLRCMNIEGNHYHLYAGGGLMKDSILEQEWQETEAKLGTMRMLLLNCKL